MGNDVALKPCPFCGGKALIDIAGVHGNLYVICGECQATSDDGSRERVIAAWNRRPASGDIAGALELAATPDGWKLVPVKETPEMQEAAYKVSLLPPDPMTADFVEANARIYRAMLSAAPVPPSGGVAAAAPITEARIREIAENAAESGATKIEELSKGPWRCQSRESWVRFRADNNKAAIIKAVAILTAAGVTVTDGEGE